MYYDYDCIYVCIYVLVYYYANCISFREPKGVTGTAEIVSLWHQKLWLITLYNFTRFPVY